MKPAEQLQYTKYVICVRSAGDPADPARHPGIEVPGPRLQEFLKSFHKDTEGVSFDAVPPKVCALPFDLENTEEIRGGGSMLSILRVCRLTLATSSMPAML